MRFYVLQPLFLYDFLIKSPNPIDKHLLKDFSSFGRKKKRARITAENKFAREIKETDWR
jgi:hypothetical protein